MIRLYNKALTQKQRLEDVGTQYRSGAISEEDYDRDFDREYNSGWSADEALKDARQYSYGGQRSNQANLDALQRAKQMKEEGVSDETILRYTGWFTGADGKWRYEIDDSGMETDTRGRFARNPDVRRCNELVERTYFGDAPTEADLRELQILSENLKGVRKKPMYLDEIVRHDGLFAAYPEMRDVKVRFEEGMGNTQGGYRDGEIVLSTDLAADPDRLKSTLIHEIQHAIQGKEGFSKGASPEYWVNRLYEEGDEGAPERAYSEAFNRLTKEQQNQWTRYQELEEVLDKLFLQDEKEAEYVRYEKIQDELYERLYPEQWFRDMLDAERARNDTSNYYYGLYRNTAGEIEARDAENRRNMTAEERRNTMPDTGNEDTVFAEGDSVESLNLAGMTADGVEIYETSEEVRQMPYKKRMETFMDIMQNEYRGRTAKFTVDGDVYYAKFDEKDLQKNVYGDKKSSKRGWKAKINTGADGNIFELIENAHRDHGKSETGKTNAAHKGVSGWDYFVKTVQIDGRVYDLLANVRKKPDGEYVYYIQLNESEKTPGSPVAVFANSNPALSVGEPDTDSVSKNEPSVKVQHSFSADRKKATGSFARDVKKIFNLPADARADFLDGFAEEITDEVLRTGTVSEGLRERLFDTAMSKATVEERELYDTYQNVRGYLHGHKLTLQDKADIVDYEALRKSHMGKLTLVNEGGLPVDVAYEELHKMAPGLFPEDVINPADQLERIAEITDMPNKVKRAPTGRKFYNCRAAKAARQFLL